MQIQMQVFHHETVLEIFVSNMTLEVYYINISVYLLIDVILHFKIHFGSFWTMPNSVYSGLSHVLNHTITISLKK